MKNIKIIAASGVLIAVAVAGWLAVSTSSTPTPLKPIHAANANGSGILDGKTFTGKAGLLGKPLDIEDSWVFENGAFVSTECETQCNYPAAAYFIRRIGDAIEFTGSTRCLDKDAIISWRGSVFGQEIKGVFTWTIKRWYWTVEKKFWFEGTLQKRVAMAGGN